MIRALLITAALLTAPAAAAQSRSEKPAPVLMRDRPFYVRNRDRASTERHREIRREVRRVRREARDRDRYRELDYETDAAMDDDDGEE